VKVSLGGSGANSGIEAQVDPTFQAARVALRPLDWQEPSEAGGGHFYVVGTSGLLTGVGANGPIFSMRWTDSDHFLVLKRLSVWYVITTAYTAAQYNDFDLIRATAWTVSDSGGSALTAQRKRNANMGPSLLGDLRVSTTAALTAGTRTLDGSAVRVNGDGPPNVAAPTATLAVSRPDLALYDNRDFGVHPIVLGANEGLLVRMVTAMGAAGVIRANVMAEWAEVSAY
jgi:hypothetical protein